jgi:hypothetical protein
MPASKYFIDTILNYNLGNTTWTALDQLYFGFATTLVTSSDTGATVVEPLAASYARAPFSNSYKHTVTAMTYTGVGVTLDVSNDFRNGDSIHVEGIDAAYGGGTGIDGDWFITTASGSQIYFAVAAEPVGDTPGTVTVADAVTCTNWTTSTAASKHNNIAVTFPQSGSSDPWSTVGTPIVSIFIADSLATGTGNILEFFTLSLPLVVPELTFVSLPIGAVHITEAVTSATTYTINNILNFAFGSKPYSPDNAGEIYFGLSTTLIDETGLATVTEPLVGSYARVAADNDKTTWTTSSAASGVDNSITIDFPASTASWGIVLSLFIADSGTTGAGNILWRTALTPGIIVQGGTQAITFDGATTVISFRM